MFSISPLSVHFNIVVYNFKYVNGRIGKVKIHDCFSSLHNIELCKLFVNIYVILSKC